MKPTQEHFREKLGDSLRQHLKQKGNAAYNLWIEKDDSDYITGIGNIPKPFGYLPGLFEQFRATYSKLYNL